MYILIFPEDNNKADYEKARIKFEAKRGWSYLSDIALDDIMLRPEPCQKIPIAGTTASPMSSSKLEILVCFAFN